MDDEKNIELYSALLKKYGADYQALDWGSEESQQRRFEVLTAIGVQSGDTILDVGCGLGDLYGWLNMNIPGVTYTGIDITPDMIKHALTKYPGGFFIEGAIQGIDASDKNKYDYVLTSGIFSHRQNRPVEFLHKAIHGMYTACRKGVAFNCLSGWRAVHEKGEFYADPAAILQFCRSLTERIVFRHDYHAGDFTIYMYKHN